MIDVDYYVNGREYERILRELEKVRREWIDPQRIVELAKRYTDEDLAGKLEIVYYDHEPDRVKCWSVYRGSNRDPRWFDGYTLDEALKMAEA